MTAAVPYAQYAVSISDQYSGAYNYIYGLAWNIDVWALQALTMPAGKTYYLWVRNGTEWYQYRDVRYLNGKWQ